LTGWDCPVLRGQITLKLTIWAKKSCPVSGIENPVFRVFHYIKNRREKFGTDEIVRFHGDSCIERIRFRGFLLYLDLQACKKLAHGGVKVFDDYMCTSVNVKKCISYIVNENYKICYTVQYIKVQDLFIFTMLCTFYVFTG